MSTKGDSRSSPGTRRPKEAPPAKGGPSPLPPEREEWWRERMTHYPEKRAILLPLLHDLQDHIGYLSREALRWAADFVDITPVEVYGVATFYWMYDYEPRAKKRIAVCHNISCDLLGKDAVVDTIREELSIEADGKPSTDGEWSLRTVECMGSCTTAPMMAVNGRYFENLSPESVRNILEDLRNETVALRPSPAELPSLPGERLAYAYSHDGGSHEPRDEDSREGRSGEGGSRKRRSRGGRSRDAGSRNRGSRKRGSRRSKEDRR